MILVVAESDTTVEALADRQVERVSTIADAVTALEARAADAVLFDGDSADVDGLVGRLRAGEFGPPRVPIVLARSNHDTDALPLLAFDRTVDPGAPTALRNAIQNAFAVANYQQTLRAYYEECRERAERGVTDPLDEPSSLRELRSEADERLSELLTDSRVVADLSWTPPDDGEFTTGGTGTLGRAAGTDE